MKNVTLLLLLFAFSPSFAKAQTDSTLYKKIVKMFKEDQKWRIESYYLNTKGKSDYNRKEIDRNWTIADSLNLLESKAIIGKYGFPGYSLVGESGSSKFWSIVQHCDDDVKFQQRVLKLMKAEVLKKNADGGDFAYLTDRVLVNTKKKQLYGTQTRLDKENKKYVPLPIRDEIMVNKRRLSVGLSSLETYLKSMNDKL